MDAKQLKEVSKIIAVKTITCILPSKIDVEFASILGLTKDKSLIQNWTPANDNKAAKELFKSANEG